MAEPSAYRRIGGAFLSGLGIGETRSIGRRGALLRAPNGSRTSSMAGYYDYGSSWGGKELSLEDASKKAYQANEWVKACVDSIASPASNVPWRVSKFSSTEAKARYEYEIKSVPAAERNDFIRSYHTKQHGLKPEVGHPLEKLIERPNDFISRQETVERLVQQILLCGNGFININTGSPDSGKPLELWPGNPDILRPEPNASQFISHYQYTDGAGSSQRGKRLPVKNVIHLMLPDPVDPFWGISVLSAAARVIDTDIEAVKYNRVSLMNRATPSGAFVYDKNLTDDQYEEAKEQMTEEWAGVKNAGRPMVFGNEVKWVPFSLTPKELDFIATRGMNKDSICAVFGVDKRAIGQGEGGTDASVRESKRWHFIDTVIPLLSRLEAAFNLKLAEPFFGPDTVLWYDTSNVEALRQDFHEKVKSAKTLWSMGFTRNEVNDRLHLGFPDVTWGDMPILPASAATIDEDGNIVGLLKPSGTQDPEGNPNTNPDGGEAVDDGSGNDTDQGSTDTDGESESEMRAAKYPPISFVEKRTMWPRWTKDAVRQHLSDVPEIDELRVGDDGNFYTVPWDFEEDYVEGDDTVWSDGHLRFYHGAFDDERLENLDEKADSGGYKANEAMKKAAKTALKWKDDGKPGGTAVGIKRAHQIVNGEAMSLSTVKRVKA